MDTHELKDYQADDQNGESDPGNPSSSEEEENIDDSGSTDELCKPPMTPSSIRGKHLFPSPMKSQRNRTPIITKPNKVTTWKGIPCVVS